MLSIYSHQQDYNHLLQHQALKPKVQILHEISTLQSLGSFLDLSFREFFMVLCLEISILRVDMFKGFAFFIYLFIYN